MAERTSASAVAMSSTGGVLSWKDSSLGAYITSRTHAGASAVTSETADSREQATLTTADWIAKINALKTSMPGKKLDAAVVDPLARSVQRTVDAAVELEVGCMLREMGEWCLCCDEGSC